MGLLEVLIGELYKRWDKQLYIYLLYKTMFLLAYYGLFRISELCKGPHALKACDVFVNYAQGKLLLVLRSSKTHSRADIHKEIRINSTMKKQNKFCPVKSTSQFLQIRGDYEDEHEQLFVFRDGTPVTSGQFRNVLKHSLKSAGLNKDYYGTHSFRIGRATDLSKFGYSVEQIKKVGRWASNSVFKYIRY